MGRKTRTQPPPPVFSKKKKKTQPLMLRTKTYGSMGRWSCARRTSKKFSVAYKPLPWANVDPFSAFALPPVFYRRRSRLYYSSFFFVRRFFLCFVTVLFILFLNLCFEKETKIVQFGGSPHGLTQKRIPRQTVSIPTELAQYRMAFEAFSWFWLSN